MGVVTRETVTGFDRRVLELGLRQKVVMTQEAYLGQRTAYFLGHLGFVTGVTLVIGKRRVDASCRLIRYRKRGWRGLRPLPSRRSR